MHLSRIKPFGRIKSTVFIFAHQPCTHLPHFVHSTKCDVTHVPHLIHGSTLLLSISSFKPLTITLVFLKLTLSLWLSTASFYFKTFFLKFSILSLIIANSFTPKILFINLSLAYFVIRSTAVAKTRGNNTDP